MTVAVTAVLKVPHNLVRTGMYWFWEVKLNIITNKYILNFWINFYLNSHNYILHMQKDISIPMENFAYSKMEHPLKLIFFQNTEIENFYTIILKCAAVRIEPLSGP